jgi:hypothetical protein
MISVAHAFSLSSTANLLQYTMACAAPLVVGFLAARIQPRLLLVGSLALGCLSALLFIIGSLGTTLASAVLVGLAYSMRGGVTMVLSVVSQGVMCRRGVYGCTGA